jgi:hypothetical protein
LPVALAHFINMDIQLSVYIYNSLLLFQKKFTKILKEEELLFKNLKIF